MSSLIFSRRVEIFFTQMSGTLCCNILDLEFEFQCIGWANSNTGGTVITFLAKAIVQRVKAEFTDCITFGTIIALSNDTLDSQYPVTT